MKDVLNVQISAGDYVTYRYKPGSAEGGQVIALVEDVDLLKDKLRVKVLSFTHGPLTKPLFDRAAGRFPSKDPFVAYVSSSSVIVITDHPFMTTYLDGSR